MQFEFSAWKMRVAELSERVNRQIDRLLDEADKAIEQRDWPKVLVLVIDVLALDPDNVAAWKRGDQQAAVAGEIGGA